MNEVMDGATTLPGILLFWLWWVFLTFLEAATRTRRAEDTKQPTQPMSEAVIERDMAGTDIAKILRLDPAFDLDAFLKGAHHAYEVIVEAFAAGDMEKLEPLLSPEVQEVFAKTCTARARRGEIVDLALIGTDDIEVVHVEAGADSMEVTLRFHAQIVWVERSAEGVIIGGDPAKVIDVAETWTFARPIPVTGNAWILVATSG